ncbi:cysteine--tRNA ligase [Azospirillum picis]|uniref:Cysteine--tRNA ligase n=1 Tax=Azospirillum picis TaxID=488438 RepID=A0ABU0MKR6_9PROT|nr:cysteine--tRNA ligase [Azospirillum picis]MBP2300098.1 cysteinyl-tRNA synthetase [Azospirillum picis]MDQ0534060.1 cysteinyl-tRNA synthetase [Azospirillum picis]
MPLDLYNTLTRRKERFEPLRPDHVGMYVCGPTVYDTAHIGNARPVVVFDLLFRLLSRLHPAVTYVRNITDVDDKIIDRARDSGEPIDALTARTTGLFHADMDALNALRPTIEPRATQHIGQMIALIATLIERGNAYAAEGHVMFSVPSMPSYGQLSRRSLEDMIAGARVEVAPYKRDASDFVLWKPSSPDQPGWDSPWGRGRPGWHIECSAMAKEHLGVTFDIHGGGLDLIFPHHENEIAQSCCANGTDRLARFWVHNGFVTVEGEKMSKSLGNFFTVHELLDEFPGEAIRLTLLSAHYRQPLDFTRDGIRQAKGTLDRWYQALRGDPAPLDQDLPFDVLAALEDDLNSPLAISHLHELATAVNKAKSDAEKAAAKGALLAAGRQLGLLLQEPEAWFRWAPKGGTQGLSDEAVEQLIAGRKAARAAKNFAEADRIRKELADQGIILEDGPQGTSWKRG